MKKTAAELKHYRPSRHANKLAGFNPSQEVLNQYACPDELSGMEHEVYAQQLHLVACFPSPSSISALLQLPEILIEHSRAREAVRNTDANDQTLYMRAVGSSAKLFDRIAVLCKTIASETKIERLRTSIQRDEAGVELTMDSLVNAFKTAGEKQ